MLRCFRPWTWLLLLAAASSAHGAGPAPLTLVAVGDLLLGGSAAPLLRQRGFDYPFAATRELLQGADLTVGNLEAPLTDSRDEADKTFRFKVPPAAVPAFARAGFDVLTLANNHLGDFGPQGVLDTLAALDAAGIARAGAGANLAAARQPALLQARDQTVAFLAYSNTFPTEFYAGRNRPGTAPGRFEDVASDVRAARARSDYVVVSFHWGAEKMTTPKEYQRTLARIAIDNGAQVVLGHHPHVLQGVEFYGGGVIFYSLGNFAFGSWSTTSRLGGLARVTLAQGVVAAAELIPVNVYNAEVAFQPRPLEGEAATRALAEIRALTEPLGVAAEPLPGSPALALSPRPEQPADILAGPETGVPLSPAPL